MSRIEHIEEPFHRGASACGTLTVVEAADGEHREHHATHAGEGIAEVGCEREAPNPAEEVHRTEKQGGPKECPGLHDAGKHLADLLHGAGLGGGSS